MDWALQISDGSVVITETPTTGNIQMSTLTVGDIVLTGTATGNFVAGGGTTVIGTSPISVATSGSTATVSLNASYATTSHLHTGTYQPFGTYVTSVSGTAPITSSGTTAITVGIDQTAITANSATNAEVIRTYVKNTSGSAMTKGQAVYVSGADGTNVTIQLSTASTEAGSSKTLGLLAQDLANNAFGYVIENGLLVGIDTSAATAGQTVWLGNTPGSRVYGAPPAEPSHSVYLGVVARSNVNNGEILVKVQNGYELDELHDVSVGSPTDGDIIQYKTSSSLWTKSSIASAGIAASVHTHPYQAAGTYVTAVNGTAPIAASTNTAGIVSVSLTATYSSSTHSHDFPPTGSIVMWATSASPSGWLFLDGSTYSQATYPALAAVFGVVSGTFTLPDMRDRFVGGLAVVGALTNNAGTFAPNTANIHTHTTDIAHAHADTIAVATHGDHTHTTNPAATASGTPSAVQTSITITGAATAGSGTHTHSTDIAATASGAENTNLTHTVSGGVTSLGTTSVTSSNGSLTPKSTLLNFIIKA